MVDNHIYEPLKGYKNIYKDLHDTNTQELFEELVLKSNINVEENKETVKQLKKAKDQALNIEKSINKYQGLKVFLIVLIVVGFIIGLFNLLNVSSANNALVNVLVAIISILISIGFIFIIIKRINPFMKKFKEDKDFLELEIKRLLAEANAQMAPLNQLFNDNQHIDLFKKTIPIINIDNSFNIKRYEYLVQKFGLNEAIDTTRSTLFVKSGDINGNPFYIANDLVNTIGTKNYSGSIVITYRTYTTVNGKRVATTHTQTLTATITKPYPYYNEQSYILYGNEAAPNLSFSRTDSDAEHMNQKQIDKEVTKVEKKLKKVARKSIKKGGDYTVMANSEFEVLWHAIDRDNEVQFRLLFTPLAQKQLLELMKEKEIGFGDNFDFIKQKMINIVIPEHLQMFKVDIRKEQYYDYDFKEIKNKFITLNNKFLRYVYFGFAPILSIPLYQQHKPHEYIYKDLYDGYVSFYEHEMIVNKLNNNDFAHPDSKTKNIIKTKLIKSGENKDTISVTSYGFNIINRTDFVTKMGMDGKLHTIPVHWEEFIPVDKTSHLEINIIEEENEENVRTKIENLFTKLQNKENLTDKELYIVGKYLTRIIK